MESHVFECDLGVIAFAIGLLLMQLFPNRTQIHVITHILVAYSIITLETKCGAYTVGAFRPKGGSRYIQLHSKNPTVYCLAPIIPNIQAQVQMCIEVGEASCFRVQ